MNPTGPNFPLLHNESVPFDSFWRVKWTVFAILVACRTEFSDFNAWSIPSFDGLYLLLLRHSTSTLRWIHSQASDNTCMIDGKIRRIQDNLHVLINPKRWHSVPVASTTTDATWTQTTEMLTSKSEVTSKAAQKVPCILKQWAITVFEARHVHATGKDDQY